MALDNPLVVILLAVFLAVIGVFSFLNVNVEAYPDPAPAIVEVVALFPGASAEEVERQVTIPLEVTFAGMPGLKTIHSQSLFGLSDLKMNWHYGSEYTYQTARQEVINRMATITQPLPPNVTPAISPESPTGEIYRYVLKVPKDRSGREIYTLNDLKAMQDWVLEREFRTVPRIVDVTSFGGTVRRYEVQPDPDRLRRYGITLPQLQATLANSNATVGGDYVNQGQVAMTVRSVGLFGGGVDPVNKVLGLKSPAAAASILRAEECAASATSAAWSSPRSTTSRSASKTWSRADGLPRSVARRTGRGGQQPDAPGPDRLLEGRPRAALGLRSLPRRRRPRRGRQGDVHRAPAQGRGDVARPQGRQGQGRGAQRSGHRPDAAGYADRALLRPHGLAPRHHRNRDGELCVGIALVVTILFMFVNNMRTAIIVAINIPLALLFAFSMLYVRGKSANLLSIGAVDFGIIVDSSVVMVENIYRNLAAGNYAELPIKERILRFVQEIEHALLYSTLIMVCAFVPLFAMTGPEGQLFGPMAQTYAFSLAGALVLALTLTPVLCMLLFKHVKPVQENWLVRNFEGPLPEEPPAVPEVSQDHLFTAGVPHRRHRLLDPAAWP